MCEHPIGGMRHIMNSSLHKKNLLKTKKERKDSSSSGLTFMPTHDELVLSDQWVTGRLHYQSWGTAGEGRGAHLAAGPSGHLSVQPHVLSTLRPSRSAGRACLCLAVCPGWKWLFSTLSVPSLASDRCPCFPRRPAAPSLCSWRLLTAHWTSWCC